MKVKKSILIAVLSLMFIGYITAQDDSEPQYLFDLKTVKTTIFGGFITDFSTIDGDLAVSSGGGGGFLFNYSFYLGFYGQSLITDHLRPDIYPWDHTIADPQFPIYTDLQLSFENNGIWCGYINSYKKLIHWEANVKIGHGVIALYDKGLKYGKMDQYFKDNVFVVSPEIDLELNLRRWFKISIGVGYRFVSGVGDKSFVNSNGELVRLFKESEFNSPYANIKFLLGGFAKRHRSITNE